MAERLYWMGCILRKVLLEYRFGIDLLALKHKLAEFRL